jgi:hypothetical protein
MPAAALPRHVSNYRVVIVSHELSLTGAPRVCAELAALLAGLGAHVSLGVLMPTTLADMQRTVGQLLEGLPGAEAGDSAGLPFELVADGVSPQGDAHALALRAGEADVVVLSTAIPDMANFVRRLAGQRTARNRVLAWWIHEGASVMSIFPPTATQLALQVLAEGAADVAIFPSSSALQWWDEAAVVHGLPSPASPTAPSLARVVHWGIPPWRAAALTSAAQDEVARAALRASLGLPQEALVFVSLASFHALKGHEGIVRALKRAQEKCPPPVPPLYLLAVGHSKGAPGHFPPASMAEWVDKDASLVFRGATQSVAAYLAAGDVYVTNTQLGGETWGLSNLEALVAGRLLLSSSAGAAREQLAHGVTALLHNASGGGEEEVQGLAENMCAVARDGGLREALRREGTRFVTRELNGHAMERAILGTLFRYM